MKIHKFYVFASILAICVFGLLFLGCPADGGDENKKTDTAGYDMTGTYAFTKTGGNCTWEFTSDRNYECLGYAISGTKIGTWKSKGNDVTIYYSSSAGSITISGEEVFTIQENGNQLILTLKDNSATTSVLLVQFGLAAKSVTLTKMDNDDDSIAKTIEMVSIPAGTFIMGSPENEPNRLNSEDQHSVTLTKSFYMSKYQVTQAQYQTIMGAGEDRTTIRYGKGNNYPIYNVNWYDAIVFCNKLSIKEGLNPVYSINGETNPVKWGSIPTSNNETWNRVSMDKNKNGYRLPTEAEWEYACRGNYPNKATERNTKPFGIGDGTKMVSGMANFDATKSYDLNRGGEYDSTSSTYLNKTTKVGSYTANNYGLYDMHGNLWEYCWDHSEGYSSDSQTDPTGGGRPFYGYDPIRNPTRMIRGGCWNIDAGHLRSAGRVSASPSPRGKYSGFRLVRNN
jgi:formylglycine-generating enzyme required for sulfatase activity